jgi:hypothetical protein
MSLGTAIRLIDRARRRLEAAGGTGPDPATVRDAAQDLFDSAAELLQLAGDIEAGIEG